jgi:hypothetical protein
MYVVLTLVFTNTNWYCFFSTLNVPFGFFINDTRITSVGNKLAVNKAITNDIEQTSVTK